MGHIIVKILPGLTCPCFEAELQFTHVHLFWKQVTPSPFLSEFVFDGFSVNRKRMNVKTLIQISIPSGFDN